MTLKHLIFAFFKDVKKSKNKIESILKTKLEKKNLIFTGMCRSAFIIILDYLKESFPKKNEIIVCSYNLKEMIDVARLKKFKIKFIDIERQNGLINLEKLNNLININTSALLYTNMFNDHVILNNLKIICKKNDILFIEDVAIYYGNHTSNNNEKNMAGSFGDVSLLSFGIMKNISALYGGALATSNNKLAIFAQKKITQYKNFPKLLYFKQILLFLLLKILLSKFIYNLFFYYIVKIGTNNEITLIQKLIYPSMKFKIKKNLPDSYYSRISNISINIIEQILTEEKTKNDEIIRKKNNQIYYYKLRNNNYIKTLPIQDINFQNFLDFPILVKNKKKLVNYFFNNGIEVRSQFYDDCETIFSDNSSKNATYYEKNIICLPSHPLISKKKILKICELIDIFYLN